MLLLAIVMLLFAPDTLKSLFDPSATTELEGVYALANMLAGAIAYLGMFVVMRINLRRRFFIWNIALLFFCFFQQILGALPFITKLNLWFKWAVLQVVACFCYMGPFMLIFFLGKSTVGPESLIFFAPFPLFALASFLYLKFEVLKENPMAKLLVLHPRGRTLLEA
jgi:hypothetical protein